MNVNPMGRRFYSVHFFPDKAIMEKLIDSRLGNMSRVEKPRKFKIHGICKGCKEIVHSVSFFLKWICCNHLASFMLLKKAPNDLARFLCAWSSALGIQIGIIDFFVLLLQLGCFITIWRLKVRKLSKEPAQCIVKALEVGRLICIHC